MSSIANYLKLKGLEKWNLLNKIAPKFKRVMIIGDYNVEYNAVELANYINANYEIPVYFAVSKKMKSDVQKVLQPGIKLIDSSSRRFHLTFIFSKYVFLTHVIQLKNNNKKQQYINVWHGVGHKKIRIARGDPGFPADVTVATSKMVKKMFSGFFGVPQKSVFISGYPRNDLMLRAQKRKEIIKNKVKPDLTKYDKILIWMPTFRRLDDGQPDRKMKLHNAFNIPGFDVSAFNAELKKNNAFCLLKLHYYYSKIKYSQEFSHIKIIDDEWILKQGITLYHLLACTDILITDFSSVMTDYSLLDQPVICFSKDLEEFKKTQGLYFEDIENWLPTELIQNEDSFFRHLNVLLAGGKDPYQEKRRKIRDLFFKYKDTNSSQRLAEHTFGNKIKKKLKL